MFALCEYEQRRATREEVESANSRKAGCGEQIELKRALREHCRLLVRHSSGKAERVRGLGFSMSGVYTLQSTTQVIDTREHRG